MGKLFLQHSEDIKSKNGQMDKEQKQAAHKEVYMVN